MTTKNINKILNDYCKRNSLDESAELGSWLKRKYNIEDISLYIPFIYFFITDIYRYLANSNKVFATNNFCYLEKYIVIHKFTQVVNWPY